MITPSYKDKSGKGNNQGALPITTFNNRGWREDVRETAKRTPAAKVPPAGTRPKTSQKTQRTKALQGPPAAKQGDLYDIRDAAENMRSFNKERWARQYQNRESQPGGWMYTAPSVAALTGAPPQPPAAQPPVRSLQPMSPAAQPGSPTVQQDALESIRAIGGPDSATGKELWARQYQNRESQPGGWMYTPVTPSVGALTGGLAGSMQYDPQNYMGSRVGTIGQQSVPLPPVGDYMMGEGLKREQQLTGAGNRLTRLPDGSTRVNAANITPPPAPPEYTTTGERSPEVAKALSDLGVDPTVRQHTFRNPPRYDAAQAIGSNENLQEFSDRVNQRTYTNLAPDATPEQRAEAVLRVALNRSKQGLRLNPEEQVALENYLGVGPGGDTTVPGGRAERRQKFQAARQAQVPMNQRVQAAKEAWQKLLAPRNERGPFGSVARPGMHPGMAAGLIADETDWSRRLPLFNSLMGMGGSAPLAAGPAAAGAGTAAAAPGAAAAATAATDLGKAAAICLMGLGNPADFMRTFAMSQQGAANTESQQKLGEANLALANRELDLKEKEFNKPPEEPSAQKSLDAIFASLIAANPAITSDQLMGIAQAYMRSRQLTSPQAAGASPLAATTTYASPPTPGKNEETGSQVFDMQYAKELTDYLASSGKTIDSVPALRAAVAERVLGAGGTEEDVGAVMNNIYQHIATPYPEFNVNPRDPGYEVQMNEYLMNLERFKRAASIAPGAKIFPPKAQTRESINKAMEAYYPKYDPNRFRWSENFTPGYLAF